MIRFTYDQEQSYRKLFHSVPIRKIDEYSTTQLSEDVEFTPGPPVLPEKAQNGPTKIEPGPHLPPLASGQYIKTDSSDGADFIDDLTNYVGITEHQCIFYPDTKYAICGWSDSDPAVPEIAKTPIYDTISEAANAFNDYGYHRIFLPIEFVFHIGPFAKAYEGDAKYRWQGQIHQDPTTGKYYLWTDGPEPDPIYAIFFGGGIEAVRDWHDNY
jgi:hypothetical protein